MAYHFRCTYCAAYVKVSYIKIKDSRICWPCYNGMSDYVRFAPGFAFPDIPPDVEA